MKKVLLTLLILLGLNQSAQAQVITSASAESNLSAGTENADLLIVPLVAPFSEATPTATTSASVVNPEAKQIIQEKKDQDVTETTGGKTDELAAHLLESSNQALSWNNFLINSIC